MNLRKPWTIEEDNYIKNNWIILSKNEISKTLVRTPNAIKRRANQLGIKKQEVANLWKTWEEDYLKINFPEGQKEVIVERLNRTWMAIRNKAKKLRIKRKSRMRFVNGVNHYFFDKWSEEMAYILGFIAADGNISKNRYRLSIKLAKKDEIHLTKIRDLIAPIRKIRQTKRIKDNKKFEYVELEVCSKYMCQSLIKLGILPKKSLILEFPQVPRKFIKDFIRGNFDGDGCISKDSNSGYWQMNFLGTEKFLDTISRNINENIGIQERNIRETESRIHIIKYATYDAIKLYNWLYKDSTIYLERKYNKFQQLLAERNITINNLGGI